MTSEPVPSNDSLSMTRGRIVAKAWDGAPRFRMKVGADTVPQLRAVLRSHATAAAAEVDLALPRPPATHFRPSRAPSASVA